MTHWLGLLCDLLWSDPDKEITGWSENDRGVSFTFGPDVVSRFLQKHDMDLICRAHQVRSFSFTKPSYVDCKRRWKLSRVFVFACYIVVPLIAPIETNSTIIGRRRRLRILRKASLGDAVLCAELLRRVRQRGCDDECG